MSDIDSILLCQIVECIANAKNARYSLIRVDAVVVHIARMETEVNKHVFGVGCAARVELILNSDGDTNACTQRTDDTIAH